MVSDSDDDYSFEAPSPKRSKGGRSGTPRKGGAVSGSPDEESPSTSTEEKKRRKQHNPWCAECVGQLRTFIHYESNTYIITTGPWRKPRC